MVEPPYQREQDIKKEDIIIIYMCIYGTTNELHGLQLNLKDNDQKTEITSKKNNE